MNAHLQTAMNRVHLMDVAQRLYLLGLLVREIEATNPPPLLDGLLDKAEAHIPPLKTGW